MLDSCHATLPKDTGPDAKKGVPSIKDSEELPKSRYIA